MKLLLKVLVLVLFFATGVSAHNEKTDIILGVSPDYPPFEFIKDGELVGFDIDLARKLSELLGYNLTIKTLDFHGLIPSLKSGRVDFVMSGMNPTEKRAKQVDFSEIYYDSKFVLIFPESDFPNIESGEYIEYDFNNKKIGTQLGSLMEQKLKSIKSESENMEILSIVDATFLLQELKKKTVDAVFLDDAVAKRALSKVKGFKYLYMKGSETSEEGMAIAFKKGSSLTKQFNNALTSLQEQGFIEDLKEKWLVNFSVN